jgi:hypothetical protein
MKNIKPFLRTKTGLLFLSHKNSVVNASMDWAKPPTRLRAPAGCLQYFTEPRGTIDSWNYDGTSLFGPNYDYTICFKYVFDAACTVTVFSFRYTVLFVCNFSFLLRVTSSRAHSNLR